jgi:hypothetical protein
MNSPRGSVVGYGLQVDKFIGNAEKCEERENREIERARGPVKAHRTAVRAHRTAETQRSS